MNAQVQLGFRLGASTPDLKAEDFRIFDNNGLESLNLALTEAEYGVHAGLVLRIYMGKFFLQPELMLNSNRANYRLDDVNQPDSVRLFQEKYQYLDIPFLLGYKAGPLRIQGGPVGHVYLSSASGLDDFESAKEDFKNLTLGYQVGLGLDLWKFTIDMRYEGNFNKAGEHFNFFGESYAFSQSPSRLMLSVGFMFGNPPE